MTTNFMVTPLNRNRRFPRNLRIPGLLVGNLFNRVFYKSSRQVSVSHLDDLEPIDIADEDPGTYCPHLVLASGEGSLDPFVLPNKNASSGLLT